jgi:hypothetical protein
MREGRAAAGTSENPIDALRPVKVSNIQGLQRFTAPKLRTAWITNDRPFGRFDETSLDDMA